MRKSLVAVLASMVLTVTACSGNSGDNSSGGSDGENVKLSYALWNQDQAPVMEELMADFTKANPNISVSVQVTPFGEYFTKVQTAITGGAGPDVFWLNAPNLALYASNDVVVPLDEKIKEEGVQMDAYPESLVKLYTFEDKVYALPRDYDTVGLWYNKKLFAAAGVEPPTDDWTWEDVRAAAKKLTNKSKGVHGIAAPLSDQQGYYNTIAQAGGHVVSEDGKSSGYDDPKTIEGLKFWTDLIKDGSSPTHAEMTDTEPKQMFLSGKVAMFYGGSWQAVSFKASDIGKDLDVVALPAGEKDTSIIHGLGNAINANSKNQDAAWELAKFLSSKEASEKMGQSGIVIPAYEGTEQGWLKAFPEYKLQSFIDQVDTATPFPVTANTAEWQALEKQKLPRAWSGQAPVDAVAKELATEMDKVLEKQ